MFTMYSHSQINSLLWPLNQTNRKSTRLKLCSAYLLVMFYSLSRAQSQVVQTVSIPKQSNYKFGNLIIDNANNDNVYAGLENSLYKFTKDLTLIQNVITGPALDNPACVDISLFDYGSNTCQITVSTDGPLTSLSNFNQILAIDTRRGRLITCGTLYQGVCQSRDLSNINSTSGYDYTVTTNYLVASNKPDQPTIGFVAPGPYNDDVLYVGSSLMGTDSNLALRKTSIGYISFRSLSADNIFKFGGSGTGIVPSIAINKKTFTYVAGFSYGGFSYFLSVFDVSGHSSKILQVCQKDASFFSYVDMPITCGSYDTVISAALVTPGSQLGLDPSERLVAAVFTTSTRPSDSALCAYKISDIRTAFTQNLRNCYVNGNGIVSSYYNTNNPQCQIKGLDIDEKFCGNFNTLSPLTGTISLLGSPVLTMSGIQATGITSTQINGFNVLLMGTSAGEIKKVVQNALSTASVFESIPVASSSTAINQDLMLSSTNEFLYVMTVDQIKKVTVTSDCSQYQSCNDCVTSNNPYCGWCTFENKCSKIDSCSNSGLADRWLSKLMSADAACPFGNLTNPASLDISQNANIVITISNLPAPQSTETFSCNFGSGTTQATYSVDQLICRTPDNKPQLIGSQDYVTINIGIQISSSSVNFLNVSFTFFSCSRRTACSACTNSSSHGSCEFCLTSNQCQLPSSSSCSPTRTIKSPDSCPRITPDQKEILMLSGETKNISVDAVNLPAPLSGETGYSCKVGSDTTFSASLLGPTSVLCLNVKNTAVLDTKDLKVVWGQNFAVENSYKLTVYDCNGMAQGDCSTCLSFGLVNSATQKFGCVWCSTSCAYQASCQSPQTTCPAPVVTELSPKTGPLPGGTPLTITGTNLGSQFGQVNVNVGGKQCTGIQSAYVVSRKYVCSTPNGSGKSAIAVTVGGQPAAMNTDGFFTYQDPQVLGLSPTFGPMYGGTLLTITGTNLDTGANANVKLGQQNCSIVGDRTQNQIICKTHQADSPVSVSNIVVSFDGTDKPAGSNYRFTDNPQIITVSPARSLKSGGCIISGTGTNLLSGAGLRAQFIGQTASNSSQVTGRNDTGFSMMAPKFPSAQAINLTFLVDDDNRLQKSFSFTIDEDPKFDEFDNGYKTYSGQDNLQITGKNFDSDCVRSLLRITVGGKSCVPCAGCITPGYIYCTPPSNIFSPVDVLGSSTDVVVYVGDLKFELGSLTNQSSKSLTWQIAVAVIGGVFVIVVVLLIIIFTRKSFQSKREYKKLLGQMNALESRVRAECRQAFADLQTEVSDFTSDIHVIGIPFWDFKMYTFKLLFPGPRDHRILHPPSTPKNKHGGFNQKMHQFNQLLSSKYFLLIFIRTLEKQEKDFTMRDRAVVASLLMVVLLNKMEYATDIVEVLLGELIDRSVEKKAPKIMLRRTESVVEKLLANWLSLAMYGYIKKQAGPTLFMLFKAIKHQTEKGPVDAVTSEARYSLSEIRLLREKTDPNTLVINIYEGEDDNQTPVTCKMLDCDTITQAKEKALDAIHMNAPYSKRPKLHQVDLFWKTGRNAKLPLHDEDKTTVINNGCKHINTLGHYNIPDKANFALIQKSDLEDSVHNIHGNIEINSGTDLNAITVEIESGSKSYHLTKQDDNQNISRSQKVISEIFLTRLLSTKITLQQYIDDLFTKIFLVDDSLPPVVKYLYDYLDNAAAKHGITDADVVHAWKSNSLPLRFWVNMITNPEFLFDINKSVCVESNLSVIAQAFMESCSTYEHRPTKDAPTTKLLFAKDIPRYRQLVEQFYRGVREMPPISNKVMNQHMTDLSMTYTADFNLEVALGELYEYATRHKFELLTALDNDPSAKKMRFGLRFQQLESLPESDDPEY